MATAQSGTLLRYIQKLAAGRCAPQWTDRQLLDNFAARGSEAAFAALVSRHGPMVWRVCRRVLNHDQDAEDAFQATFLVLAGNTGSIRKPDQVATWLHGVAYRTAMKAKRSAARRRNHEARGRADAAQLATSPTWDDVQSVLDEEIQRLPACFRQAFVLCVLEGKSGSEAAAELGCKEGTVKSRLNRARGLLQRQLTRRGIQLATLLAALSVAESASRASMPATLAHVTVQSGLLVAAGGSAAGQIPSHIAALAAGVTRAMFLTKAKIAVAVLFAVSVVTGAGVLSHQALAGKPGASQASTAKPSQKTKVAARSGEGATTAAPVADDKDSIRYSGRVLGPDGKPFAGAKLYLAGEIAKTRPFRAKTGDDGRFQFTVTRAELKVPAQVPADVDVFASLQVVALADGYGPDWTLLEEKRPKGELTLRLVKNDVTFKGRILDLQGRPVAGAKLHVLRLETTQEDDLAPFIEKWKSDRTSYFALNLLAKVLFDPSLVGLPKTVTTGPDGRFRLPGAGNERIVMLSVEAPLIERITFRVLPRSEAEVKALVQPPSEKMMQRLPPPVIYASTFDHLGKPARMITGTVRDKETGKPIAGIRVWGNPIQVTPTEIGPRDENLAETHTDKDGNYQLKGLAMGEKYQVFAWPTEFGPYIPGAKEVIGREGLATLQADFELVRGIEVRGRITDKVTGKPVAAGVVYRPGPDNTHPAAALFRMVWKACDGPKVGTFREMVPPGTGVFLVTVRGENHYTQARLDPADKAKSGLDEIFLSGVNAYRVIDVSADTKSVTCDIQVDPGRTVTGRVLGPDDKPFSGAMVKGLTPQPGGKPTSLKSATFTIVGLDSNESRELLFVEPKKKLAGKLLVRGDDKGERSVRLEPWGTLTGRILDEDGQPMAGVRIKLSFPSSTFFQPVTWWVSQMGEEVKTDTQGRFRADGITPGMKFRLHAFNKTNFLTLSGGTEGVDNLSTRGGETKDLGDLKARPN